MYTFSKSVQLFLDILITVHASSSAFVGRLFVRFREIFQVRPSMIFAPLQPAPMYVHTVRPAPARGAILIIFHSRRVNFYSLPSTYVDKILLTAIVSELSISRLGDFVNALMDWALKVEEYYSRYKKVGCSCILGQ